MSWRREEILLATGGEIEQEGKEALFAEVETHSNKVKKGSVFVALKGERFDGHAFLKAAVRRGARAVIVHRRPPALGRQDVTVIRVADTLEALGDLAHYRRAMAGPKILAVTGSNGKTTTKEMIAAILERASISGAPLRGKLIKTEGNYNNLVGLPLTLLRLRGGERVAVLELGTSRPGEIRRLTEIADPDMGLVTAVAPAHLEGLGNLAGVAREKGELFCGIQPGGIAVVNLDDPWVRRLGESFKGDKITYGRGGDVAAENWRLSNGGLEFTLRVAGRRGRVRLKLSGLHNLSNALGAAAMAYGFGVEMEAIRRGLEAVGPLPMRMAVESWRGMKIINDAYNANPASMEAALKTLARIEARGEKIAILGDMLELGRESPTHHRELGKRAARCRVDRLYLLGKQAGEVRRGALMEGMDARRVIIGEGHREIARMLHRQARRGDWLLVKGSRGMRMEKVLAALREMGG